MDWQIEFEELLQYAKQALSGVSIEKREVIGFTGLAILDDVVRKYEIMLKRQEPDVLKCGHQEGIEYADPFIVCVACGKPAKIKE